MKIEKADRIEADPVKDAGAEGVQIRVLIGQADGAPNFTMRQFTIAPGGCTPLHSHRWEHEVYILAGSGAVDSSEGPKPIGAGDCVFVAPGEQHRFRNAGPEELKFLCLIPKSS